MTLHSLVNGFGLSSRFVYLASPRTDLTRYIRFTSARDVLYFRRGQACLLPYASIDVCDQ